MPKKRSRHTICTLLVTALGLALVQLACGPLSPGGGIELTEEARPVARSPQTPSPIPVPELACLGSFGYGVTCLSEAGWQTFTRENSRLGWDQIRDIAVCPDGQLLMLHTQGLSAFDGESWKEYENGWGTNSASAAACDKRGNIWVTHFRGVSYYDKISWQTYASSQLSTGRAFNDLVEDVAVAPDGKVWVATANSVALFNAGEWTIFQEGQGFEGRYFFDRIAVDSRGRPWVAHSRGVAMYTGEVWVDYENRDTPSVQSLAIDAQDRVWIGTLWEGVYIFEGGGWLKYTPANSDLGSDTVQTIAADEQGRVWLGTTWGLYVLDGKEWHAYRMNNASLGDNDIYAVAVAGRGPTLPSLVEKAPGALSGRVVSEGGQPVRNAAVEVCVKKFGTTFYAETPCTDQPFVRHGQTDANGDFRIQELPPGYYVITVESGDGWAQLANVYGSASERVLVQPGEEIDLGEIAVTLFD